MFREVEQLELFYYSEMCGGKSTPLKYLPVKSQKIIFNSNLTHEKQH